MIDKLPPLSQLRRAVADDDDLARRAELNAAGRQLAPARPTLAQWTEVDDLKATIIDGFNLVQLAIASANTPKGKTPPKFKPTARPKTAWQRAQKRRDQAMHADILAQVMPSRPS